jgi:hypothetical protein
MSSSDNGALEAFEDSKDIYLNVYDLHESNSLLYAIGGGFFHSGIEIAPLGSRELGGYEYSYTSQGVVKRRTGTPFCKNLRSRIKLGTHTATVINIYKTITKLSTGSFTAEKYHLITNNCNHFSDAFSRELLQVKIPRWVNRMAKISGYFYSQDSSKEKITNSNNNVSEDCDHTNARSETTTVLDEASVGAYYADDVVDDHRLLFCGCVMMKPSTISDYQNYKENVVTGEKI